MKHSNLANSFGKNYQPQVHQQKVLISVTLVVFS